MIITLNNPPFIKLTHKQSGKKFNTSNTESISYDDEKFEIENNNEKQKNLF